MCPIQDSTPQFGTKKLDPTIKFIPWFDKCELGGPIGDDDVDNIIGDPDYVPNP